jgi:DNA-binding NarL/FixJ family response regulator
MVTRVVLAEDHLLIREGLRTILERADDIDLAAVCGDYDALLSAVDEHEPDVVLTDIRMPPGMSDEGIAVAEQLRRTHPDVGVVVLSQHDDPDFVMALLEEGSQGRGYLLKERTADPDQLVAALHEVAAGGSVIDPKVVEVLVRTRLRREASPLAALTERERDVLAEMASGKDNAAIAAALFLTVRSVEKYINGIFSKLGLSEERDVHRRVKAVLVYLAAA